MNVTVVKSDKLKDKDGYAIWKVTARQDDGIEVEAERASKFPPKQGDKGTVEASDYGPKFVPANSGGGRKGGRSPQDTAQIVRQHSAEMALRYAAIQAQRGKLPDDFKLDHLKPIIDWFDADAKSAKP